MLDIAPSGLLGLLAWGVTGRILLSLLPPGWPGYHSLRELAQTWAASHLLGGLGLALQASCYALLGIDVGLWTMAPPWVVLGVVRWLCLPGSMRPRHELPLDFRGAVQGVLLSAVPLALGALWVLHGARAGGDERGALAVLGGWLGGATADSWVAPACLAAVWYLVLGGLERARRSLRWCLPLVALGACMPLYLSHPGTLEATLPTLLLGGGAAAGVAWLRRADRRARALALFAFAGLSLYGCGFEWVGLAGLAALVPCTPGVTRRRLAVQGGLLWLAMLLLPAGGQALTGMGKDALGVGVPLALLAVGLLAWLWLRLGATAAEGVEPPGRELTYAWLVCALASLASVVALHDAGSVASAVLYCGTPVLVLCVGLSACPAERVGPRA